VHKEELIKLHQVMSEIKDSFERTNTENSFSEYYSLKITPSQQHKSKTESMKDVEYSASNRISARMGELAHKTEKEIEYLPDKLR